MTFNEFEKQQNWQLESYSFDENDQNYLYYLCTIWFTIGGEYEGAEIQANNIRIRIDRHYDNLDLMDESKPNEAELVIEREVNEAVKAHVLKLYNLLA